MTYRLTGILYVDSEPSEGYLVYCPQLDVLTQGDSVEHAQEMIQDAVEGVIEILSVEEVERRLSDAWSSLDDVSWQEDDYTVVEVDRFSFAVEAPLSESAIG